MSIVWSQTALDDIDAIASFIHKDSPFYAKVVVEKIIACADLILQYPLSGRVVPEFNQTAVRERFVYSYRVIYEIKSDRIEVLAVVHGKRLF